MSARIIWTLVLVLVPAVTHSQEVKSSGEKLTPVQLSGRVNQALAQAKVFQNVARERATLLLEEAMIQIDNAEAVPEMQRAELRQRVQKAMQEMGAAPASAAARPGAKAIDSPPVRPAVPDRAVPSAGNVSGAAKSVIEERTRQLDAMSKLKQARGQASSPVQSGLQTSAKPSDVAIEFDKSWKELTEMRAKTVGNRLSAKEIALVKALDMPLKVDFNKMRFREVLNYLAEKTGQAVIVPEVSLEEAMVDYDSPVTLKVGTPVAMRSILLKVLRDHGLTYVVKDESIVVVTPERAREMMVTRVYPVMDLCGPPPNSDSPFHRTNINGLHLKRLIENMIAPEHWDVNGGAAVVHYSWINVSLSIRAPGELHLKLGAAGFGSGK